MELPSFQLPKAELHLHIEGTLEPELILELAERNKVALKHPSIEALRAAYNFTNLQSFLDVYYATMTVLRTEQDFADLASAYFVRAHQQGVVHAEIFFDPQAHTSRGVPFHVVLDGLWSVMHDSAARYGITSKLIMCFLRDKSAESAMETLESALPYTNQIIGVGLDSAEVGNPPRKFEAVFRRARANGLKAVAHAGEEGPPEYIWEALDLLKVQRVDHGVRCLEDAKLTARLRDQKVPLTVCPFSNVRLRVVDKLQDHPLGKMLDAKLLASVNSDDPAYFGGYIGQNYDGVAAALSLPFSTMIGVAKNSFESSFLTPAERTKYLARLDAAVSRLGTPATR